MSINEFAMVEELAYLIKDNLTSKHLVLSVEEALLNFLHDDTSLDGFLELEPMNPYNRLLVHRLAEIFGFAHESTGEGEDRHLVLERCPETSIPSILVSDILWQYDEPQSHETSYQLLRRKDAPTVLMTTKVESFQTTIEEREAAYMAARQRIFAGDAEEMREPAKERPRNVPVVARRMIAHALGQKIQPPPQDAKSIMVRNDSQVQNNDVNYRERDKTRSTSINQDVSVHSGKKNGASSVQREETTTKLLVEKKSGKGITRSDVSNNAEHVVAAKRIFAQALGIQPTKSSNGLPLRSSALKQNLTRK